jgi:hypothetical protein
VWGGGGASWRVAAMRSCAWRFDAFRLHRLALGYVAKRPCKIDSKFSLQFCSFNEGRVRDWEPRMDADKHRWLVSGGRSATKNAKSREKLLRKWAGLVPAGMRQEDGREYHVWGHVRDSGLRKRGKPKARV